VLGETAALGRMTRLLSLSAWPPIRRDQIAAKLGRARGATAMEASKLNISLSLQPNIRRALRSLGIKEALGE